LLPNVNSTNKVHSNTTYTIYQFGIGFKLPLQLSNLSSVFNVILTVMKMLYYKPKALYYRESSAAGLYPGPEISGGSSKRDILSITILFKWSGGCEALKVIFMWFPRIPVGSNILSNKRDLSLSRTSCLKVTLMARITAPVPVSLK